MAKKTLHIYQQVQLERGGTRHLGRELGRLLEKTGYQSINIEKVIYSAKDIGWEEYKGIFLPVAKFYLDSAAESGIDTGNLYDSFCQFCEDPSSNMDVCFWHVSAIFR